MTSNNEFKDYLKYSNKSKNQLELKLISAIHPYSSVSHE